VNVVRSRFKGAGVEVLHAEQAGVVDGGGEVAQQADQRTTTIGDPDARQPIGLSCAVPVLADGAATICAAAADVGDTRVQDHSVPFSIR
jgi:hypothetical protein